MAQLNINLTSDFERNLKRFMRLRKIKSKSDAIRIAVKEVLEISQNKKRVNDFSKWIGLGKKAPLNPQPRFTSEDDLWSVP